MSQYPTNNEEAQRLSQQVTADREAAQQGEGLEAAPNVDLNFQHAQASATPLEPPIPEPPNIRTTSFAKELDAQDQQQQSGRGDQQQHGEGSGMVGDDKPELKPVNRTQVGKTVDQSVFDQAWAAESERADEMNRLAEAIAAKQQAINAVQAQRQPEQQRGAGLG